MGRHYRPSVLAPLKDEVLAELRKHPAGLSKRGVQSRFGVSRPDEEESRKRVWLLNAALVGLQRDGDASSEVYHGERYYYPRRAV